MGSRELQNALRVAKETVDGWTAEEDGRVHVHKDVISHAINAAVSLAAQPNTLRERLEGLAKAWRTQKWVDDYMAGEYFDKIFIPERACADELEAALASAPTLASPGAGEPENEIDKSISEIRQEYDTCSWDEGVWREFIGRVTAAITEFVRVHTRPAPPAQSPGVGEQTDKQDVAVNYCEKCGKHENVCGVPVPPDTYEQLCGECIAVMLGAAAPPAQGAPAVKCWHKEINDEGICKACGAKAAIKLEGMPVLPAKGRSAVGLHADGNGPREATQEEIAQPAPPVEAPAASDRARKWLLDHVSNENQICCCEDPLCLPKMARELEAAFVAAEQGALRKGFELIAKWRKHAAAIEPRAMTGNAQVNVRTTKNRLNNCADELESALAQPATPSKP